MLLASGVQYNASLKLLDLSENGIGDAPRGLVRLLNAVQMHKKLKALLLAHNRYAPLPLPCLPPPPPRLRPLTSYSTSLPPPAFSVPASTRGIPPALPPTPLCPRCLLVSS